VHFVVVHGAAVYSWYQVAAQEHLIMPLESVWHNMEVCRFIGMSKLTFQDPGQQRSTRLQR
jgi:hypothetical protein